MCPAPSSTLRDPRGGNWPRRDGRTASHAPGGGAHGGYAGHHLNSKFDATGDLVHIEALLAALPRTLDTQDAFHWIAQNLRMVEEMERAETALCPCSALSRRKLRAIYSSNSSGRSGLRLNARSWLV